MSGAIPPNLIGKWLAALAVSVAIAALIFRLGRVKVDYISLEDEVRIEFDAFVEGASEDFARDAKAAELQLEKELRAGFVAISEEFTQLCLKSDGFIERSKGAAAADAELCHFVRTAITQLLTNSLAQFKESYVEQVELLESRLLVKTSLDSRFMELEKQYPVVSSILQPSASELRGSGAGKTLDELAEWVPIAGEAYGLAKLLLGDPREEAIKIRAKEFINQQEAMWRPMIAALRQRIPSAEAVKEDCRTHFSVSAAIAQLP